jgi:ferredoxin-type protein NapH
LHRGLVYGGLHRRKALLVTGLVLFDLGIASRGWCTHLCPVVPFMG